MGVGLVHDYLLIMRGAERTFASMADMWPDARIYTTLYDIEGTDRHFAERDIRTSFLQRTGVKQNYFRRLLPLFPAAVERLPVASHDVIVSSSSAFAHGVRPRADAAHVCYCHTPFRYAWSAHDRALAELPTALRVVAGPALERIRRWDLKASTRVTHYVANSEITRERIARFYGREAALVHPPVEIDRFIDQPAAPEDWFLIVTALVTHKLVDRALDAARAARRRVKVVGDGPDRARWEAEYADVAEFLGKVGDDELPGLYSRAAAVLVPKPEEFGIVAVEAQAAGRPVLAVNVGGAHETVIHGETGLLVELDEFADALRDVDFTSFDPEAARANAKRFTPQAFQAALRAEVERATRAG